MTDHRARGLEELYRRRSATFRRTLTCVTGDWESAADAVQEGFARALAGIEGFRDDGSLEAWVWRICVNQAHNARRRRRTMPLDDSMPGPATPLDHDPNLAAAIRALPEKRRLVVFLRYFAELTYEEIAEVTGQRPGTVAATLSAARGSLAKSLATMEAP